MTASGYPSLYQINARVFLQELGRQLGRPATLDDIADDFIDQLAGQGFNWLYLLSVWQTGPISENVARTNSALLEAYRQALPDFTDADIGGSGFAVASYRLHSSLGEPAALTRLLARLHQRGLKLMLDFVPNHTALDHPWVEAHPDFYVHGDESLLAVQPGNYTRIAAAGGNLILAHGRDPYFAGWTDTLQLNYGNAALKAAMIAELKHIASSCDGLRCDMSMLILPEIFQRTWGIVAEPFWAEAIAQVKSRHSDFLFMAEVYWDLEWEMQCQGFDYTYDKRLYDRLCAGQARPVREHFLADLAYQNKSARFLENHDEPRAAATFPLPVHECAAVLTFLCPGLRFIQQGQLQGARVRLPVQLLRAPQEINDPPISAFYDKLLACLRLDVVRNGRWQLIEAAQAWDDNASCDAFLLFAWQDSQQARLLVAVNYADHRSQCYARLPLPGLDSESLWFRDLLGAYTYERPTAQLLSLGLYLDLPAWGYHVFAIENSPL